MEPRSFNIVRRVGQCPVALETTLLVHGVPRGNAVDLYRELGAIITQEGASPALVGLVGGTPIAGMSDAELRTLLGAPNVAKANTSNLGVLIHRRSHGATTVSATMEIAAATGIGVFATGGLGGVHRGYAEHLDISSDLGALARFPVAVVASGVKSILDVAATRELLETLGVPVIGVGTDKFPAFYLRDGGMGVDARFDDVADLARFVACETARTRRAVLVANPVPASSELDRASWERWLEQATQEAAQAKVSGRDATPFILGRLHELSAGATLRANIELVKSNAKLAAKLAVEIGRQSGGAI